MAVFKEELRKRVKGALMEDESWWHLCYDSDSKQFWIEHSWDRVNPYKLGEGSDVGSTRSEVEAYTGPAADRIEELKEKLVGQANA